MALNAGTAFLQIVPSFKGLVNAVKSEARNAGREAGQAFNQAFNEETGRSRPDPVGPSEDQEREEGTKSAGAFAEGFRARLAAAARSLPDLQIGADGTAAEAELAHLKAMIEGLRDAKIGVDLSDAEALQRLAALRAELDRLSRESPSVRVRADTAVAAAQLAKLEAALKALDGEVARPKIEPRIDEALADREAGAFIARIKARIEAASKSLPPLQIGASTSAADQKIKELQARLAALKGAHIGVDLSATEALAKIRQIQAELANLSRKSPSIQVRVDTGRAAAELAALQAELNHLNGQSPRITPVVDVSRSLPQISILKLAILGLLPAIAPLGAAGVAALAGLGAAAGTAAVGIGVVALAIKGTQTALKNQTKAQKEATTAAQESADAQKQAGKAGQTAGETAARAAQANQKAQEGLFKAMQSGQGIGDAYNKVLQTQADGARNVAKASGNYQDALNKNDAAQKKSAESAKKLAEANAKVTPAMKEMADFIKGTLKPELEKLQQTAAAGFFPGALAGLKSMNALFPQVNAFIGATAKAMGDLAAAAGKALQGPFWRQFLTFITTSIGPAIKTFGQILGGLLKGFAGLFQGLAPLMAQVGGGVVALTNKFAAFGEKVAAGKSEKFNQFLSFVKTSGPLVAKTLGDIVGALGHIVIALAPLGPPLLKAIDGFANFIKAIPPGTVRAIAIALLAVGVALNTLFIVGGLVIKFQALAKAFGFASVAGEEGMLATLGPIGLVAAAVIALTVVVVAFHKQIGEAFSAIGSAAKAAAGAIAAPFKAAFSDLVLAVKTNVGLIKSTWNGITGFLGSIVSTGLSGVKAAFSDVVLAVKINVALIKSAWNALSGFFVSVVTGAVAGIGAAFHGVVAIVSATVSGIKSAWSAIGSFLGTAITAGIAVAKAAFNGVVTIVKGVVSGIRSAWGALKSVFGPVVIAGIAAVKSAFHGVVGIVQATVSGIKSAWGALKGFFGSVISAGMAGVSSAFNAAKTAVSSAVNAIKATWGALRNVFGPVISAGMTAVKAAFNGVRSVVSSVVSSIKSIWNSLRGALSSPLSSTLSGIRSGFNAVYSTVASVASKIKSAWNSMISYLRNLWNKTLGKLHVKIPGVGTIGFPTFAKGGVARKGVPSIVGEVGPELLIPGMNSLVVSNRQILQALAAAGSALPPGLVQAVHAPQSGREWTAVQSAINTGRVGEDSPGLGPRAGTTVAIGVLNSGVNPRELADELDWKARGY